MSNKRYALIIEDNATNSDILRELLNSESVVCTTIQDPRLIDDYMSRQAPPDVIFLDLEMPHINGYEVLDMLKADEVWASVPVVACTIHVNEIQTARTKAFHSFIGKPLDMEAFPDQIQHILNDEPVWDISRLR